MTVILLGTSFAARSTSPNGERPGRAAAWPPLGGKPSLLALRSKLEAACAGFAQSWPKLMSPLFHSRRDQADRAFARLDTDRDGLLDASELYAAVPEAGARAWSQAAMKTVPQARVPAPMKILTSLLLGAFECW